MIPMKELKNWILEILIRQQVIVENKQIENIIYINTIFYLFQ